MKTIRLSALFCAAALAALMPIGAAASTTNISCSDSWSDAIAGSKTGGYSNVTSGSGSIQISLPFDGETDISTFDSNTEFYVYFGLGNAIDIELSDDPAYRVKKSVLVRENGSTISLAWTSNGFTMTGSTPHDFLDGEQKFGNKSPGTYSGYDVYDAEIIFGPNFDNDYDFYVKWKNTDTAKEDGNDETHQLQNGSATGQADFIPPTLTISKPVPNLHVESWSTNTSFTLSGTAGDNVSLSDIYYKVNCGGDWTHIACYRLGVISTNWMTTVNMSTTDSAIEGTNIIFVEVYDQEDNVTTVTRPIFYSFTNSLILQTNGNGTITGLKGGEVMTIGQSYPVTATPSNGWVFEQWMGPYGRVLSQDASFRYLATPYPDYLQAVFVPTPYSSIKGTYTGLFYDDEISPDNIAYDGYFSITLETSGMYSGTILLGANRYPVSGKFTVEENYSEYENPYVYADFSVNRSAEKLPSLQGEFVIDANTNQSSEPFGGYVDFIKTNGCTVYESDFYGSLSQTSDQLPPPGTYNFDTDSSDYPALAPGGTSYGTVMLDAAGKVLFTIVPADGTSPTMSFSTEVDQYGKFPIYLAPYQGHGLMAGWLELATNFIEPGCELQDDYVAWIKPTNSLDKFYPNGFFADDRVNHDFGFDGAQYVAPKAGTNEFGTTNLYCWIGYGNLPGELYWNEVTYNPAMNIMKIGSSSTTNKATLSITLSTGAATGTFFPTGGKAPVTFKGLFVPNEDGLGYGGVLGFFSGTNETGYIELDAD